MKQDKFFKSLGKNTQKLRKTLERILSGHIGLSVDLVVDLNASGSLDITSKDIAPYMVPRMFETLQVTGSGTTHGYNPAAEFPDFTSPALWVSISYRYHHFKGGSNGCKIADVWIDENGEVLLTQFENQSE